MKNTLELVQNQISIIPKLNRLENNLLLKKVLITPKLAKNLLSRMLPNRNISKKNIYELVNTIKSGLWDSENGDTIKVREDGKVTDGQHRLLAIVQSDISTKCYIMFNTSIGSISNLDTGKSRSLGDIFKIAGHQYFNIKPVLIISEGNIIDGYFTNQSRPEKTMSWQKILEIGNNKNEYLTYICKSSYRYKELFPLLTVSFYAKFYNIFYKIDKYIGMKFMEEISSSHSTNKAIILFKKKLIQDAVSNEKLKKINIEAYFIKTWNNYYNGKDNVILKWNSNVESFPKVKGIEKITNKFIK